MEKYGNRIVHLRERRGLTQEDLAAKLGISRSALSHYEKDRRQPDFETLKKIANFFNVSIDYLLNQIDDPVTPVKDIKQFISSLELSDKALLEKFQFTIDGKQLTEDEAKQFIAFIRAHRSINAE